MNHLSQDQLIDVLYGVSVSQHLDTCPECQSRLAHMQQMQSASIASAQPDAFFHRQRRTILARMTVPEARPFLRPQAVWVPAAVAALLAVGVMLSRPPKQPVPGQPVRVAEEVVLDNSDSGWFEDVYSDMQATEPRALSPMRSLFVEGAVAE